MSAIKPRSGLTPQDCLKVATSAWEGADGLLASFKDQTDRTSHIPAPNFWQLVAQGRLDQAQQLVTGVKQWLTCPCRRNVVIGFTPSSFPDHGDYGSGSGIFWRYVLYACRTNADFRSWMINEEMAEDLLDNIVVASVSNPWTDANDLFQPFNTVAVGVAACYLFNEAAKAPNPPKARGCNPFSRRK